MRSLLKVLVGPESDWGTELRLGGLDDSSGSSYDRKSANVISAFGARNLEGASPYLCSPSHFEGSL
jgi:hypothetical protein